MEHTPTTQICRSTPNETEMTAWAWIISKEVNAIPAATQYCPASGLNDSCRDGMTALIVSAGLACSGRATPGSSGNVDTLSIVGKVSRELMPNPPASPVMNRNGGPPSGTFTDT